MVSHKGFMAAEQFVFARYYAYWQIYFHKTTRSMMATRYIQPRTSLM
ncbi:hypothetical protein [Thermanaeromonas sp. C210]|nr:hypothetical protein [Thermanaeromonas sp. C210]